jgi:peroxiredoxin
MHSMLHKILLFLAAVGVLGQVSMLQRIFSALCALMFWFAVSPALGESVTIGSPAPGFTARTLDGKPVALADFKGQVLVLNFWATWCAPCKKELPLLEGYYRLQGKYGLRVVAVSTERSVPPEKLEPLAERLTLTMVRDFNGPYGAIGRAVPTNFVIDRDGVVRYAQSGAFTLDRLNQVLVPLLQQSPSSPSPAPDDGGPSGSARSDASGH